MHLYDALPSCFASFPLVLLFVCCLDLDSNYELWLAMRKKWRGWDKIGAEEVQGG